MDALVLIRQLQEKVAKLEAALADAQRRLAAGGL